MPRLRAHAPRRYLPKCVSSRRGFAAGFRKPAATGRVVPTRCGRNLTASHKTEFCLAAFGRSEAPAASLEYSVDRTGFIQRRFVRVAESRHGIRPVSASNHWKSFQNFQPLETSTRLQLRSIGCASSFARRLNAGGASVAVDALRPPHPPPSRLFAHASRRLPARARCPRLGERNARAGILPMVGSFGAPPLLRFFQ